MKNTVMLENIRGQAESLRGVARYQFGEGAEALRRAAAAIRAAGRVVFTGMGSSLYASMPAAAYLNAAGFPALTADASELLHHGGASLHPGAAMVLVSRSGETVEIVRLLERPGLRAATAIGVSNERESRLARGTGYPIHVHSAADRMVAVQTYTGTAAVMMLLASTVLEVSPEESRRALERTIDALAAAVEDALAREAEWREFLGGAEVVYLLGRGASLGSVHEGALLFNESARVPTAAMSAGLFRHGPVEVVNSRFRALVFASQEATRELDLALASDLQSLGGGIHVCDAKGAPAAWAPIAEIVPAQVAACLLALDRGIDPGDFRFTTAVTTAEAGFARP